jgi:hypothetical protein
MVALTIDEYEALMFWAKEGAGEFEQLPDFFAMRKRIDAQHNLQRYCLTIRYTELPQRPVVGDSATPKGNAIVLELLRPPTREDVFKALEGKNYHASSVYLTADPYGEVGWYELEAFPWL